jgi:hypothetical protein
MNAVGYLPDGTPLNMAGNEAGCVIFLFEAFSNITFLEGFCCYLCC